MDPVEEQQQFVAGAPVEAPAASPASAFSPAPATVAPVAQAVPVAPVTAQIDIEALRLAAEAEILGWLEKHIPNSPFSRDTSAYSRIYQAVGDIRSALANVKE